MMWEISLNLLQLVVGLVVMHLLMMCLRDMIVIWGVDINISDNSEESSDSDDDAFDKLVMGPVDLG